MQKTVFFIFMKCFILFNLLLCIWSLLSLKAVLEMGRASVIPRWDEKIEKNDLLMFSLLVNSQARTHILVSWLEEYCLLLFFYHISFPYKNSLQFQHIHRQGRASLSHRFIGQSGLSISWLQAEALLGSMFPPKKCGCVARLCIPMHQAAR